MFKSFSFKNRLNISWILIPFALVVIIGLYMYWNDCLPRIFKAMISPSNIPIDSKNTTLNENETKYLEENLAYIKGENKQELYIKFVNIKRIDKEEKKKFDFTLEFAQGVKDFTDLINEYKDVTEEKYVEYYNDLRIAAGKKINAWCDGISKEDIAAMQGSFANCTNEQGSEHDPSLVILVSLNTEVAIIYVHLKSKVNWMLGEQMLFSHITDCLVEFLKKTPSTS